MVTTTITRVTPKPSGWVIEDRIGIRYFTTDPWKAALAERAKATGVRVCLWAGGGWYYKELDTIRLETEVDPCAS
jgi:hypothetical protein